LAVGPGRESGMPLGRCARTRTQRMCRHCILPDLPEQSRVPDFEQSEDCHNRML
jgi:hypothetical protein